MTRVITIGRQYGSAGHDIGQMVAEALGYKFYDKELVEIAAKKSNISKEAVDDIDEKATSSFLYSLASGNYSLRGITGPLYYEMPLNDKLFIAQSQVIKDVAGRDNCVIVGRCADYVLDDAKNVDLLNVFIYADQDFRIRRVKETFNITERQAKDRVIKTDKQRRIYYSYYSNRDWGSMSNYDMCLNTCKLGIKTAANIIINYVKGLDK
ncbi:MAG TPA: cytidylate kinase-like family protein [Candidatus Ornithomonoglobus merdipullorum]|uniref:Cytidylate kinase-like family protein n=1 Tax=Candidatus Ornithomonoglobus merdipullorum TaxID=2840895 RepID=A0A9D1SF20_9FIRM|nr:cytidylate kinase-like family protein [Candidatus Ornithomonoglobus merdipullorum]